MWKDIDGDGVGEWLVQSQDPSLYPFSIQGACWAVSLMFTHSLRSGSYLGPVTDCEAGTVNVTQFQPGAHSLPYVGQTSGELEWVQAVVEVPVLTADTRAEGRAVCSLARSHQPRHLRRGVHPAAERDALPLVDRLATANTSGYVWLTTQAARVRCGLG
jgi:hypothetical protein